MLTQAKFLTNLRPFAVAVMLFALLFGNFHAGIILAQEGPPPGGDGFEEPSPAEERRRALVPSRYMA